MPSPIATNVHGLRHWLIDYAPELADRLVISVTGEVFDSEDLHHCERCRCTNLDEDITDNICQPCHEEAEAESAHQGGLLAMVRRL